MSVIMLEQQHRLLRKDSDRMKHFLDRHLGLLSRIVFQVEFDDYTAEELCDIVRLMVVRKEMQISDNVIDKIERICEILKILNTIFIII